MELPELPFIVPLSAIALFYTQCAWGANSSESSDVDSNTRRQMLSAFFQDCAGLIKASARGNRELRDWLRDLEEGVEEGLAISDGDTRALLGYAREWSGGNLLWKVLRERLAAEFAKVTILPAVLGVINSAKDIGDTLSIFIEARRIETLEEVDRQRKYVQERQEQCRKEMNTVINRFISDVAEIINQVANSDGSPESISKIECKAREKGWQGFPEFIDFVDEQARDLINKIIAPIRDTLKQEIGVYDLEDSLVKLIPPYLANYVSRACELAIRALRDCEHHGNALVLKVEVKEGGGKRHQKIERAEGSVLALYQSVREALEHRSEFLLQAKAQTFEGFSGHLVSQLTD